MHDSLSWLSNRPHSRFQYGLYMPRIFEVGLKECVHEDTRSGPRNHKATSVGLPALAGMGKELTSEGSMPDGVTIIDQLDEPSMGESSFKGRLPPLGGSPVTLGNEASQNELVGILIVTNWPEMICALAGRRKPNRLKRAARSGWVLSTPRWTMRIFYCQSRGALKAGRSRDMAADGKPPALASVRLKV